MLGLSVPVIASADPPDWAPAHGYRHKHKHHHHDDDDDYRESHHHHYRDQYGDYGVGSGRCDTHTVAQVLGGVAGGALGGVLGSQVGQGSNAGTIVGAVAGTIVGAIIGERIGRSMDPSDRFCAGRALDYANDRHSVRWVNPESQVDYLITPMRSFQRDGGPCREFTTRLSHSGLHDTLRQTACRLPNGDWRINS
jgi:surface antigen